MKKEEFYEVLGDIDENAVKAFSHCDSDDRQQENKNNTERPLVAFFF